MQLASPRAISLCVVSRDEWEHNSEPEREEPKPRRNHTSRAAIRKWQRERQQAGSILY